MSWSVSAEGKVANVKAEIERQFTYPLSDPPAGLLDEGERETVRRVAAVISQCLDTFDLEKSVSVSAYGHQGWDDWSKKAGSTQNVSLKIEAKG
jgi:hypothetical protein